MWALGVMFYRMLFGDYPYNPMTTKLRNWKFKVPNNADISNVSYEILEGLLQKDPRKRLSSEQLFKDHMMRTKHKITTNNGKACHIYDEQDKLGEGAFAKVYRGYDLNTFEEVAIKLLDLEKQVKQYGKEYIRFIQ